MEVQPSRMIGGGMVSSGPRPNWRSTLRDWSIDIYEQVEQRWQSWNRWPKTALRWSLIAVLPFVFGAIAEDIVQTLFRNPLDRDLWQLVWQRAGLLVIIAVGFVVGLLMQRAHNYRARHADRLYYALKWFYAVMELGKDESADVRCTIWVPTGKHDADHEIRLQQVVNYVPPLSLVASKRYRENGKANRMFRVARKEKDIVLPIGILGQCAVNSVKQKVAELYVEYLQPSEIVDEDTFVDHMKSGWNFRDRQTRRLTMDRRAYMCLPMMDASLTHLLGILYIDARKHDALPQVIGDRAQQYLPFFAELLTN